MSDAERRELERAARAVGGSSRRLSLAALNAFVAGAGSLVIVFLLWLSIAWPARVMGGGDIGLQSPFAPWIVGIGVPLCVAYAAVSTVRWLKEHRNLRPLLEADLERGEIVEESYRFVAAKRFQEREHGGLLYFLRTTDDRAFVVYDSESQDLGVRGQDPLASAFRPHTELTLVRAPNSGIVLDTAFAGEPIEAGEPLELAAPPRDWPAADAYTAIPWNDLERRLQTSNTS